MFSIDTIMNFKGLETVYNNAYQVIAIAYAEMLLTSTIDALCYPCRRQ